MADKAEGEVQAEAEDMEALFGFKIDEEPSSTASPGEGEEIPRSEAPADKETPREGAGAPEGQKAPKAPTQAVPKERFDEVYDRARKYDEWEPIIKLFEDDPTAARKFILERTQGQPTTSQQPPSSPQTQWSPEQVQEYWSKRFEEDPAGTLSTLLQMIVDQRLSQQVTPIRQSVVKLAVQDYKKVARSEDPLFDKYERVFDSVVAQTDPALIEAYPEQVLSRARAMAFGMWADTQRKKIATATRQRQTLPREKVSGMEVDVSARNEPAPSAVAKPRRAPTKEEEFLAERYGIPLESLLEDEGEESPFAGR